MAAIPSRQSPVIVDQLPIKDLMINIGLALAQNAAIEAWCQDNYGKSLSVFCGTDIENPPAATDCPYVEIWANADNHGRAIESHIRSIGLGVVLHDGDRTMLEVAEGFNIVRGANNLEELWPLVITASAGADLKEGFVATLTAARDQKAVFPFFALTAEMVIQKPA